MAFTIGPGDSLREWDIRATRTPVRFRDRVLALFRAPRNVAYLRRALAARLNGRLREFALAHLEDSVLAFEPGVDLVHSDPIAQRGDRRSAVGPWSEVRRLNLAFITYQLNFLRDNAALVSGRTDDGQWDDSEPYHVRAFVADSLRPPGLEHLNGPGPLFGILEEQAVSPEVPRPRRERMTAREARRETRQARVSSAGAPLPKPAPPGMDPDDWGWDGGDPNRTPEQAIAEYWGASHVESSALGAAETESGVSVGRRYGEGPLWRETGGTRFMRYPTIPIWQNLSRGREYEREIEETLGTGGREFDTHVRRWDTDRMRRPRGEEYRRYGPRNGSTV